MLSIPGRSVRLCDGITRREVLRVGGLGFTGLAWSDWLRARAAAAPAGRRPNRFGAAKACILVYMYGGPSHLDIWDLKPDAPAEIRGEFKPAATRVPGISITEHLPRLGAMADRYAVVRSVTHRDNDHAIGAYLALTGYSHPKHAILGIEPAASPQDMPSLGSVVADVRPAERPVFSYVTLGDLRHLGNNDSMGQNAGCLGKAYDPFTVPFVRPINGVLDLQGVADVMGRVDGPQVNRRRRLLDQMNRVAPALEATAAMSDLDDCTRKAYELLASPACRDAFDGAAEPEKAAQSLRPQPLRPELRAGAAAGGGGRADGDGLLVRQPRLGHARRQLQDAEKHAIAADGPRAVRPAGRPEQPWDAGRNARRLDERNGPDAAHQHRRGRDHWSYCYSVVLAGGGVRGGQVYGASDRSAAYPSTNPVGPADVAATIYHCLGIDPRGQVRDREGRPLVIGVGNPIQGIL